MLKFLVLTVLSAIIFFFVWNILKRFFFNDSLPSQRQQNTKKSSERKYNWDAETIDYEEIKEKK